MNLQQAIAIVESSNNSHAMRFEPGVFGSLTPTQLTPIALACGYMSQPTKEMVGATSWGLYQLMGFNIWGVCGYQSDLVAFLTHAADQDACLHTFVDSLGDGFSALLDQEVSQIPLPTLQAFGDRYNGNGAAYAQALIRAAQS